MAESEKEEKKLGRRGCRWENSKEIGSNFVDCIHVDQYQFGESVGSCEGGNGTVGFIKSKGCFHWLRGHSFSKITDASEFYLLRTEREKKSYFSVFIVCQNCN